MHALGVTMQQECEHLYVTERVTAFHGCAVVMGDKG